MLLPTLKNSVWGIILRSKVKGQGHEVKKVKKACRRDMSKTVGLIKTKFCKEVIIGMTKN